MPSKIGDHYREQATLERRFAAEATLPNVRSMHEVAARKWTEMADLAERMSRIP